VPLEQANPHHDVAFQTVEDINKKRTSTKTQMGRLQTAVRNWYDQTRIATDVFLDDDTCRRYWDNISHKLIEHFHTVIELFGPRVKVAFK
jgi:hypothetical protein